MSNTHQNGDRGQHKRSTVNPWTTQNKEPLPKEKISLSLPCISKCCLTHKCVAMAMVRNVSSSPLGLHQTLVPDPEPSVDAMPQIQARKRSKQVHSALVNPVPGPG